MNNIRIAKQLIRIAKSLIAYYVDRNNKREVKEYFDNIEEYVLSEKLNQYGWDVYNYNSSSYIEENGMIVGKNVPVEPFGQEYIMGEKISSWQELKRQIDGETSYFEKDDKVVYSCNEDGPNKYSVTIRFND